MSLVRYGILVLFWGNYSESKDIYKFQKEQLELVLVIFRFLLETLNLLTFPAVYIIRTHLICLKKIQVIS